MIYGIENEHGKCGWQDQYAATMGGFNFLQIDNERQIYPLRLKYRTIRELEENLILVYTGIERKSGDVQEKDCLLFTAEKVDRLKKVSDQVKEALLNDKPGEIGKLFGETWYLKRNNATSSQEINNIHDRCIESAADYGKLIGAGRGGYFLFSVPPELRQHFKEFLKENSLEYIDFRFTDKGVETWSP